MFEAIDLNIVWFILIGVLLLGYAILDGFDLGTGVINLFLKGDTEKRTTINAIGPVWDGNEVWLVTGGGALFAAFPFVYATVFSGFYLAFMLFLLALIARAVSIEFRSKQPMTWWRKSWDLTFSLSSALASILIGVALGNILWGIPLDEQGNYAGTFLGLLNPYSVLLGITTLALFTMHGSFFLILKTEGALQQRIKRIGKIATTLSLLLLAIHALATIIYIPRATSQLNQYPWLYTVVLALMVMVFGIIYFFNKQKEGLTFACSCGTMACLMGLFGIALFPFMVLSQPIAEHSIDIYQGGATHYSLSVMTIIAIIGVPLVLAYSAAIYWVFRGKVKLDESSY